MRPNPHIALIYHYDLARALDGEPVDWQAIPVNVDAGREGGDLCRAAADFAKRRDLFAMLAPSNKTEEPCSDITSKPGPTTTAPSSFSTNHVPTTTAPVNISSSSATTSTSDSTSTSPNSTSSSIRATESESSTPSTTTSPTTSTPEPGPADDDLNVHPASRDRLRVRIADLIQRDLREGTRDRDALLRTWWPDGVPTLAAAYKHTDDELAAILAAVRRVETEVGAPWHPDDGPPPHVNTDPRASVQYPVGGYPNDGGLVSFSEHDQLNYAFCRLTEDGYALCKQIASEAADAGRTLSVSASPTRRRWTIARAVIAWAAAGRSVDDLWFTASLLATFEQTRDPAATLGGLISQFTIEQAERLYEAATDA